jgi:hypothetical protein
MISKTCGFSLLFNILLISSFSMIQTASDKDPKKVQLTITSVTFTKNKQTLKEPQPKGLGASLAGFFSGGGDNTLQSDTPAAAPAPTTHLATAEKAAELPLTTTAPNPLPDVKITTISDTNKIPASTPPTASQTSNPAPTAPKQKRSGNKEVKINKDESHKDFEIVEMPQEVLSAESQPAQAPIAPLVSLATSDMLGSPYRVPMLPDQTATNYAWSDIHAGRRDLPYVLGLIANGTYQVAATGSNTGAKADSKLPGRNSNGLLESVSTLTQRLTTQRLAEADLLTKNRTQTTLDSHDVFLLLLAINANKQKQIDAPRLESEFTRIQEARAAHQEHVRLFVEESFALDEHVKTLQEQLNKAHLTGDASLPLTPRKNLSEFVQKILTSKK